MRLRLDPAAGRGHGHCSSPAPELFDCDDEGRAALKAGADPAAHEHDAARRVDGSCPELATTVEG